MQNARILIIEDERIIAWDIKDKLESLGFRVTGSATSGEAAILHITDNKPDLVLMDIGLNGDLNGMEAAILIKDKFDLPVVFLTAFTDPETQKKAIETNLSGYVTKPFQIDELETAIVKALEYNTKPETMF